MSSPTSRTVRWLAGLAAVGCATAAVAVPADASLGGTPPAAAQPEIGDILERAIPPGARQLLAGIRVIDAWNARNRVYREARGVQRDLRAHYGALMATAERFAAEGDEERYARVQQMLAEEQAVALSLTEDEKRDAKFGFESQLRRELTNALLQVPKVREGLASLRGSLDEIRSTVEGVRAAVETGNPLSGVISEANDRLARLDRLAGFGEVIGGQPGRRLGQLSRRLHGLVDQLGAPTDGTLRTIDDVLSRLDNLTAEVDDQLDKGRWIRTGAAVRQVRDLAEAEAIEQVIGKISGTGSGESSVVNAVANAIVRERAGRDDLPALTDAELRSMRDRVEAALLGRSVERVSELCGRLASELRRTGNSNAATPRCELYGNPEELDAILDAVRAGTSTTTVAPAAGPGETTSTTTTTTTTTPPPPPSTTTTTTQAPIPPTVIAKVPVTESISGGTVDSLSITVEVVADLATGFVSISSSGGGSSNRTYSCDDGAAVLDEVVLRQAATAVGTGTGEVALGGGAYQASFDITGSTAFTVAQPYDDPRCTQFNNDYPSESPYTGSGTISGTVSADGTVTVETNWSAGGAQVSGTGSAVGELSGAG